jgi:hypothetical protein
VFSAARLEQLRQRARATAAAASWMQAAADPAPVLELFKLRLRAGCSLRAIRRISGEDATIRVEAMPEVPRFTCCLEGDGSPRSYLLASVAIREVLEFGAQRHGRWWGCERILDDKPVGEWHWLDEEPDAWAPSVRVGEGGITVQFRTLRVVEGECLIQYTDTYSPGRYSFVTDGSVIARRLR